MKTMFAFLMSASAVLGCATAGGGGAAGGGNFQSPAPSEAPTTADQQKWDPKAVAVIDQMVAALGGESAWSGVGEVQATIGFNDGDVRTKTAKHAWDRPTARHLYDAEPAKETPYYVGHRIDGAAQGKAYKRSQGRHAGANVQKQPVAADDYRKIDEIAMAGFRRELFWLTMPYRLKVAGASLKLLANEPMPDDKVRDVIEATFSGSAWQPRDRYLIFVDRQTHLPDVVLLFEPGKDKPWTGFKPGEWKQKGPLKVATVWRHLGGKEVVTFDNLSFEPRALDNSIYQPWLNSSFR